jgi:hypothetical protein
MKKTVIDKDNDKKSEDQVAMVKRNVRIMIATKIMIGQGKNTKKILKIGNKGIATAKVAIKIEIETVINTDTLKSSVIMIGIKKTNKKRKRILRRSTKRIGPDQNNDIQNSDKETICDNLKTYLNSTLYVIHSRFLYYKLTIYNYH